MTRTVIQHVLWRLHDVGINDIFGVPGDYAFAIDDAICNDVNVRWVGCCNELNAAYAADGYARIKGVGAVCTTYGVGELSAINGVAGAYAEHLPLFHLVGTPPMPVQAADAIVMHHTLGNGEYDLFRRMAEPVVCAQAVMTPQNVAYETERLIAAALYHRRPVYMTFPADLANQPAIGGADPVAAPLSDPTNLGTVADIITDALGDAATACVLPGILVGRTGLRPALQALIDASGLPFATMFMGKSVLDEDQPAYAGMYVGTLLDKAVSDFVESVDLVLAIGAVPLTDFNSGVFTASLDPARTITIGHHHVSMSGTTYPSVEMGDLLVELAQRLPKRGWTGTHPMSTELAVDSSDDAIGAAALYPRWERFLKPDDILIAESGSVSVGLASALMPKGATYHNQTLWGSIGWATPAAFGAAVAAPDKRVVLVTGEGAHQLSAQEISQFGRLGLKPMVFLLNNGGYLMERLFCKDPTIAYNDLAAWRYSELPHVFGCDDWFTARVTTCGELDAAIHGAQQSGTGAYIEVVTDAYAAPPLMMTMSAAVKEFYK